MTGPVDGLRIVDLRQVAATPAGWVGQEIPDGSTPVRLHRLRLDRESQASVSLVRFPPGWERTAMGSYAVAEEFVVLAGSLEMNGGRHDAGSWAFVPADACREGTRTPGGALALAWFGGVPVWQPGSCDPRRRPLAGPAAALGVLVEPSAGHGGTEVVSGRLRLAGRARDALDVARWTWAWLPAGATLPGEVDRLLVRRW